ncbi:MAG TPA: antibiotic biosynthesis monooxygenase [Dehalococcoidia bacterium]|nr:antibiotic biosynthesis monooxygenase [Dehalococcoidia bacterium]
MYVLRVQIQALPGKAAEFEKRAESFNQFIVQQQGCLRVSTLASLGYVGQYEGLASFTDAQAAKTCLRGPWAEWLEKNPVNDVLTLRAPTEAWEIVQTSLQTASPSGSFFASAQVTIDPTQAAAYEASRKELLALFDREARGLVGAALGRFCGGGGRYVLASVYTNRDDAERTLQAPAIQAFLQANPASKFGAVAAPEITFSEVVHSRVAAAVAQR